MSDTLRGPSVPAAVFCECQTRSLSIEKVSLSCQMNFNYVLGFFWVTAAGSARQLDRTWETAPPARRQRVLSTGEMTGAAILCLVYPAGIMKQFCPVIEAAQMFCPTFLKSVPSAACATLFCTRLLSCCIRWRQCNGHTSEKTPSQIYFTCKWG